MPIALAESDAGERARHSDETVVSCALCAGRAGYTFDSCREESNVGNRSVAMVKRKVAREIKDAESTDAKAVEPAAYLQRQ